MNIIVKIISFFRLTFDEKEIYSNEFNKENTRRALYISIIAIPVSIIHIVIFGLKLKDVSSIEQQWVVAIIFSHITILITTTICSLLIYFFSYRMRKNNLLSKVCVNAILYLLLIAGAVIASFDQYVTSSITPYINTCLIAGLIFLIQPLYSTIYYIATYIFFYFALTQTQLNQDILISNQVNGLTITAVGMCLSYILWRANLTKVKQSKQIIAQNKALLESNDEKDKFFSIVAHDLQSPFNSIIGFSDLLVEQMRKKDYEGIEKYAEIIQQSSTRAMDLLMNLMEWSQSQTGRMEFNPEYFELIELIKDTELLLGGMMEQKSIGLSKILPSNAPVFADKKMISTVLRNLISNAIKFTHPEGEISISVEQKQNELLVSVSDTGVGISKENSENLFKIDKSYSTTGTNNEKGTGLGLILCKEFVEKHGGRIWVESEEGNLPAGKAGGSTFYFTLPHVISNKII